MQSIPRGTWRAAFAFFRYELLRHRKPVLIGWSLLIVPPLVHRLVEGHWRFFAGDWPHLAAQNACLWIAPILAAMMAISGWAREREERSLEWLYARSWGSGQVFFLRVTAVLVASTIWMVGCLILYRSSLAEITRLYADITQLNPGAGLLPRQSLSLVFGLLTTAMGLGFLASAVSGTRAQALGWWFFCCLGCGIVFMLLHTAAPLPTLPVLYMAWTTLVRASQEVFIWTLGLGSLALSGWLMRRAHGEIHRRRGLLGLALVIPAACAASIVILLQPMRIERDARVAVRDLGQGVRLELVRAKGLPAGVNHPVLRSASGSQVFRHAYVRDEEIFAHSGSGRAILRSAKGPWHGSSSRWIVVSREGWSHELHLNQAFQQDPLGWSTDGRRFAWRTLLGPRVAMRDYRVGNLLILDEEQRLRELSLRDVPSVDQNPWTAAWIGEERLLITTEPMLYSSTKHIRPRRNHRHWWMAISPDGESLAGPHPLPARGRRLFSPALSSTPAVGSFPSDRSLKPDRRNGAFSQAAVTRVGDVSHFLLAGDGEAQVVSLHPETWELRPGAELDWDPGPFAMWATEQRFVSSGYVSLGALEDGTLVWTARTRPDETIVFSRSPREEKTRRPCFFQHAKEGIGGFRGAAEGWAIWAGAEATSLYACHLASGTTRQLTDLGPLGARSVDVTAVGILGLEGWIELEAPGKKT